MTCKRLALRAVLPMTVLAAGIAALWTAPALAQAPAADVEASRQALANLSLAFNDVAERTSPAVVYIEVEREMPMRAMPRARRGEQIDPRDFFERFFGGPGGPGGPEMPMPEDMPDMGPIPFGQGSGFVISEDGYIVTNHHVVGQADVVKVTMVDGRQFTATLVGTDPQTEIALIKVDAQGLPHLRFGDSDALKVGDWVLAIGSPFGLTHSVTSGIISARGRGDVGIVDYADFIQTDAAINPGNSGGPLLNLYGEVVGMNTAILSRTGGNMGIGFAIPVNMIRYVQDELRRTGTVQRGYLGVHIQPLTQDLARHFNLDERNGVVVANVQEGSPAEQADLRAGDVIVGLNGQRVGEVGSFRSRISTTTPGSEVSLTIVRDSQRSEKKLKVGSLDADESRVAARGDRSQTRELGITVQTLTPEMAEQLGYVGEQGVVVTEVAPNSAAARARPGVARGDLIQEVNRQPVSSAEDFRRAVRSARGDNSLLLLVRKGEGSMYIVINLQQ